jgi:hypothetical protein
LGERRKEDDEWGDGRQTYLALRTFVLLSKVASIGQLGVKVRAGGAQQITSKAL